MFGLKRDVVIRGKKKSRKWSN